MEPKGVLILDTWTSYVKVSLWYHISCIANEIKDNSLTEEMKTL